VVACGSMAIGSPTPAMRTVTSLACSSIDSQSVPTSSEMGKRFPLPGPVSMPNEWWSLGKPLRRSADGGLCSIEVPDQKFGFCLGAIGLDSIVVPWSVLLWNLRVWVLGSRWPEAVVGGEGGGLFDELSL